MPNEPRILMPCGCALAWNGKPHLINEYDAEYSIRTVDCRYPEALQLLRETQRLAGELVELIQDADYFDHGTDASLVDKQQYQALRAILPVPD